MRAHQHRLIALVLSLAAATALAHASESTPARPDSIGSTASTPAATDAFQAELLRVFATSSAADWTLTRAQKTGTRRLECAAHEAWDLRGLRALQVTADCHRADAVLVYLRWRIESKAGGLYECAETATLSGFGPSSVALPLTGDAGTLIPVGHQRPWDDLAAAEVTAIELQAEWRAPFTLESLPIALSGARLEAKPVAAPVASRLLDLELCAAPATSRATGLLSFRIEPPPLDPFAVSGDGDVRVVLSNGREVLAWLDQDVAGVDDGRTQRSIPVARPMWRAWVNTADAAAAFKIKSGTREWPVRGLAIAPAAHAEPQPRTYRWTPDLEAALPASVNGERALPAAYRLGANGAWLPAPEFNGAQSGRCFRPVPFWNAAWSGYGGARTVNFVEAARMDAELDAAARAGRAQPLAILPGDTLGLSGPFNWSSHPLQPSLGLRGSALTEVAGFDFYARGMRYAVARWGASRAVASLCVTTEFNSPHAAVFYRQLGAWLSTLPHDAAAPFVTTDVYAAPLNSLGVLENFSAAAAAPTPLAQWRADQRFNRAGMLIRAASGANDPGFIEVTAADPAAVAIGAAGTYQFGVPPLLAAADGVSFDVFIPADAPSDLRAGFHAATLDGEWFDAVFAELLRPGEWNRFVVDLTGKNRNALHCVNGTTAWSDALRARINELGVHLFSTHPGWRVNGKVQHLTMRVGALETIRFAPPETNPAIAAQPRAWPPEIVQTLSLFDSHALEFFNSWQADGRLGKASGQALYHAGPEKVTCFEVRAADAKTLALGAVGRFVYGTRGDLSAADALLFDLWVPPNAPADLRAGVHFVDDDGRWIETVLQPPPAPGEWTTFAVDLSAANLHRLRATPADGWQPGKLKRLFELGIHLYSIHPNWKPKGDAAAVPLSLRLANVRAVRTLPARTQPPPATPELGAPTTVATLSDGKPPVYKWYADERTGSPCNGSQSVEEGQQVFALQSTGRAPAALCITGRDGSRRAPWDKPANDNLFSADALVFQVWCPAEQAAGRVGVHVRDRNGLWFDTLLPGTLNPGEWSTYALDLTAENVHRLRAVGHSAAWTDYSRQRLGEIGIHIFAAPPAPGAAPLTGPLSVKFRDIHTVAFESIQRRRPAVALTPFDPLTQQPAAAGAAKAELLRGELWESHVQVGKTFDNPFDPCDCDLNAVIVTPSGKTVRVPAFFDQVCRRREATPGGDEIVEPSGQEFFTVRYRAVEAGPHSVTWELREGGKYDVTEDGHTRVRFVPGAVSARLALPNPVFTAAEPPATAEKRFHGFMRCADDRRHFQFEDGTFFYPIGPCLRSPSDTRVPYIDAKWGGDEIARINRRGTYQYDDYIAAAAKNGVSWARVWMCSWWGGLEWRRDWPGYQGAGRYNLLNAWRIDHVIELAEQNGMEINLCLTNHGQFAPNVDTEWANNPYSMAYGGPLQAPREFFTRPEAKILHQNKLRYVVARYGHSPAVMAWALFSECEFTQEYSEHENNSLNVCDWHAQMADFLKEIDPNKHLVTTHFSHPHHGIDVLAIPEIDFATSNAYSAFNELTNRFDAAEALASFWSGRGNFKGFTVYKKPALVEEQGRHFMGGGSNTRETLDADLHAGIWGSLVQPLSGATGYWWWLHLHFDKRWEAYKPFAAFMKGEDLRPAKDEQILDAVEIPVSNAQLKARALRSKDRLYLWIYHVNAPLAQAAPPISAATLKLTDLRKGTYHIQFWNTYTGAIINQMQVMIDGEYELHLPTVTKDIAVKVLP